MILKYNIDSGFGESWEIRDKVENINYSRPSKEERQAILSEPNRYIQEIVNGRINEKNQKYVYAVATLNNSDKYFSILSNKQVYLLSDEGKTIERLN